MSSLYKWQAQSRQSLEKTLNKQIDLLYQELNILIKDDKRLNRYTKKKCNDLKRHIANILDYFIVTRAKQRHEIIHRGNMRMDDI